MEWREDGEYRTGCLMKLLILSALIDSTLTQHDEDLSSNQENCMSLISRINVDLKLLRSQCVRPLRCGKRMMRGGEAEVTCGYKCVHEQKCWGETCVLEGPTARRGTLMSNPPLGSFSPRRAGSLCGSRPVSQSHTVFLMAWRTLQWEDRGKTATKTVWPLATESLKLVWGSVSRFLQKQLHRSLLEHSGTSAGKQIPHYINNFHFQAKYGYVWLLQLNTVRFRF